MANRKLKEIIALLIFTLLVSWGCYTVYNKYNEQLSERGKLINDLNSIKGTLELTQRKLQMLQEKSKSFLDILQLVDYQIESINQSLDLIREENIFSLKIEFYQFRILENAIQTNQKISLELSRLHNTYTNVNTELEVLRALLKDSAKSLNSKPPPSSIQTSSPVNLQHNILSGKVDSLMGLLSKRDSGLSNYYESKTFSNELDSQRTTFQKEYFSKLMELSSIQKFTKSNNEKPLGIVLYFTPNSRGETSIDLTNSIFLNNKTELSSIEYSDLFLSSHLKLVLFIKHDIKQYRWPSEILIQIKNSNMDLMYGPIVFQASLLKAAGFSQYSLFVTNLEIGNYELSVLSNENTESTLIATYPFTIKKK